MLKTLRKLWSGEIEGIAAGAAIVSVASFASRALGVVRDRMLATQFGAGDILDAYYAAFRLPDFLYNLLVLGALSAGFIPLFSELKERHGMKAALKFTGEALSLIGFSLAILCAAGIIFAPLIVPWLAPGFDLEKREITASLTRIMFLSPFFLGISALMGGVLQSTKRFFAFAFAPLFYNVGIIIGILGFVPFFGIAGLAWGVVFGALLHGLVQYLAVRPIGKIPFLSPSFASEPIRRMLKLMVPRTAGLAVTQVNLVIILFFASSLGEGSVSVFNLAGNLQSFPLGLVGVSFAVAAFPVLSQAIGANRPEVFREALHQAARRILYFVLPLCVVFLLLRAQIVRVVLGDGQFDWNDTRRTFEVFALLTIALPAQALIPLLIRAFYAMQRVWMPLVIGFVSEGVTALVAWLSYRAYGIDGLAYAIIIGSVFNVVLLYLSLRRIGVLKISLKSTYQFCLKLGFVLLVQASATYLVRQGLGIFFFPLERTWAVFLQGAVAGGIGGMIFLWFSYGLCVPESRLAMKLVQKVFGRVRGTV